MVMVITKGCGIDQSIAKMLGVTYRLSMRLKQALFSNIPLSLPIKYLQASFKDAVHLCNCSSEVRYGYVYIVAPFKAG